MHVAYHWLQQIQIIAAYLCNLHMKSADRGTLTDYTCSFPVVPTETTTTSPHHLLELIYH